MGFENYISESEAATVTGVGVTTLRRFAEAGYFKVETETDGLRLYATSELEKVFGSNSKVTSAPITEGAPPPKQFKPWEPPPRTLSPESNGTVSRAVTVEKITIPDSSASSPSPGFATQPTGEERQGPPETGTGVSHQSYTTYPSEPRLTPPSPDSGTLQSSPSQQFNGHSRNQAVVEGLDREVQKLKTVSEMHERLLCIREEEIRSLREEREWLRARIEKLEEKGSRDQLLLLSETQTIKALITIQEQRRSPVRQALEWLGFITPPPVDARPPRSAIDVSSKGDEKMTAG